MNISQCVTPIPYLYGSHTYIPSQCHIVNSYHYDSVLLMIIGLLICNNMIVLWYTRNIISVFIDILTDMTDIIRTLNTEINILKKEHLHNTFDDSQTSESD